MRTGGKPAARTDIDQLIGSRVRARRQQLKLGQLQLARRIGLHTAQAVGSLESGKNKFSAERLIRAAEALKIPIGQLVGEDPGVRAEPSEQERWWNQKLGLAIRDTIFAIGSPHRELFARQIIASARITKAEQHDGTGGEHEPRAER